ncbi:MAG: DNA recombination protein RmuC [Pseudomonadota bacterium]
MTESWLVAAVLALGALLVFVAWRLGALIKASRELPSALETRLGEQHRAFLGDLHEGLARQGDRVIASGADTADRLRTIVAAELKEARDTLNGLNLALQGKLDRQRAEMLEQTLKTLAEQARADRELLQSGLAAASSQLAAAMDQLTRSVNERLEAISGKVNERLDEGFRKTNETFVSVMARLATIDEAQKKIDGLTSNVVSLQELLGDKRSRGAFGEVQLEALVRNVLPPGSFEFQYTLPNNFRADCVLHLPEPTGMVAVDSKFPLENYHRMFDAQASELERRQAQSAFRTDLKKHIDAIASKYIIANVTSDGAVMFVPAEAVFAEIHAYHGEVVSYAQHKRVWIVSPTTLMAVLNTARAVLKDVETRRQIHVIKDALGKLSKDFARFDERMQKLATHIKQAHDDVQDVQISSRKITGQFQRIEGVELDDALPQVGYRQSQE